MATWITTMKAGDANTTLFSSWSVNQEALESENQCVLPCFCVSLYQKLRMYRDNGRGVWTDDSQRL